VKRSGRDEPMWVSIHMCMEAILESLYRPICISIKSKFYAFLISYVFSSMKSENKRVEQVLPGKRGGVGIPNNVYTCE
jgi:hypothetical protein